MSTASLVKHTVINKEFFVEGSRLTKKKWRELVEDDVVVGKVIADDVYIDRNRFAVNTVFARPENQTAIDLLMKSA